MPCYQRVDLEDGLIDSQLVIFFQADEIASILGRTLQIRFHLLEVFRNILFRIFIIFNVANDMLFVEIGKSNWHIFCLQPHVWNKKCVRGQKSKMFDTFFVSGSRTYVVGLLLQPTGVTCNVHPWSSKTFTHNHGWDAYRSAWKFPSDATTSMIAYNSCNNYSFCFHLVHAVKCVKYNPRIKKSKKPCTIWARACQNSEEKIF